MASVAPNDDSPDAPSTKLQPRFPFREPGFDIILRSCDGVEFQTLKFLLSLTSKTFEGMFIVAKPAEGVQSIDLDEDGATLDLLLSFCDPRASQFMEDISVDVTLSAIAAASKYEIKKASDFLLASLNSHIPTHPLRIYAIACHHLDAQPALARNLAFKAALELLHMPLHWNRHEDAVFSEVNSLPTRFMFALSNFHEECGRLAEQEGASRNHWWRELGDKSLPYPEWWWHFLDNLSKHLRHTPRPHSLFDLIIESRTHSKPGVTTKTKPSSEIYQDMKNFEQDLLERIDITVSKVPLELGV